MEKLEAPLLLLHVLQAFAAYVESVDAAANYCFYRSQGSGAVDEALVKTRRRVAEEADVR